MSGKYNVGYEINKKRYFRKQFGPSTIIGAYNVFYNIRHLFIMKAHTEIISYIIRKEKWFAIMGQFEDYAKVIQ